MTKRESRSLGQLEGRRIGLALADGSRIDDATLVSARSASGTLWLFAGGADVFVPAARVLEAWEWRGARRAA